MNPETPHSMPDRAANSAVGSADATLVKAASRRRANC
jgi:hypothetical protein